MQPVSCVRPRAPSASNADVAILKVLPGAAMAVHVFQATLRYRDGPHPPTPPSTSLRCYTDSGGESFVILKQACSPECQGAQFAFKDSMIHGILQFTLRIAFRCVLHRCESQEIRCQKLFVLGNSRTNVRPSSYLRKQYCQTVKTSQYGVI